MKPVVDSSFTLTQIIQTSKGRLQKRQG